jgi:hypothetical protein
MQSSSSSEPVYASVDAVQVPAGIAPGQQFTAYGWGVSTEARNVLPKHSLRSH